MRSVIHNKHLSNCTQDKTNFTYAKKILCMSSLNNMPLPSNHHLEFNGNHIGALLFIIVLHPIFLHPCAM